MNPIILNAIIGKQSYTWDSDALSIIGTTPITNDAHKIGVNDFVKKLKGTHDWEFYGSNVWTKMYALYIYYGTTASEHKWNWKDLRDLDAAYRLTFMNDAVGNHNGGYGYAPGSNNYAKSFLVPPRQLYMGSFIRSFTESATEMGVRSSNPTQNNTRLGYNVASNADNSSINLANIFPSSIQWSIKYGYRAVGSRVTVNDNPYEMIFTNGNLNEAPFITQIAEDHVNALYIGAFNNANSPEGVSTNTHSADIVASELTYAEHLQVEIAIKEFLAVIERSLETITDTNRVVFVGDSITNASATSNDTTLWWATKYCADRGYVQNNISKSARALTSFTSTDLNLYDDYQDWIPPYLVNYHKYLIIPLGVNDYLHSPLSDSALGALFETQLGTIINYAITKGWPANKIVLANCFYGKGETTIPIRKNYINTAIYNVSQSKSTLFVDIYNYIKNNGGDTLIKADNVHYTADGQSAINDGFKTVI